MQDSDDNFNRRSFIEKSAYLVLGTSTLASVSPIRRAHAITYEDDFNIIGPKAGYTLQIGTLVSMLNWMRRIILSPVYGMSIADLDYLHDAQSNTIGALLLHLAATERFYQIHTFEGKRWGNWPEKDKEKYSVASELGEAARKKIKGNSLDYYLNVLKMVREHTLNELAKRNDDWLMQVDENWSWGPTNNYCKWFHVCEHESNHNGQIKWLKKRLPG